MKKRQNLTTGVLLMTAIVVVINIFSYFYFFKLCGIAALRSEDDNN